MIGDAIIITTDGTPGPGGDTLSRALIAGFEIAGSWSRQTGGILNTATTYVVLRKHLTGQDGGIADIRGAQVPPEEWFS